MKNLTCDGARVHRREGASEGEGLRRTLATTSRRGLRSRVRRALLPMQQSRVKWLRQQFGHSMSRGFTLEVPQNNLDVACKFPQELPTCATRGGRRIWWRDDSDAAEVAMALRQRLPQRHAFGTDGQPVGRVLDVASGDDRAVAGFEGSTHFEAGKVRARMFARGTGRCDQVCNIRIPDPGLGIPVCVRCVQ